MDNTKVEEDVSLNFSLDQLKIKDKRFIFHGNPFPINFKLFKLFSPYFNHNIKYKSCQELIFKYPTEIKESSFECFIKACQDQDFEITQDNVFDLLYLSYMFNVELLKNCINDYIKSKGSSMIINLFKYKMNLLDSNQDYDFPVEFNLYPEEEIIGKSLIYYLKNHYDFIISLPIHIIYQIFNYYGNKNSNINKYGIDNKNKINDNKYDDDYDDNDDNENTSNSNDDGNMEDNDDDDQAIIFKFFKTVLEKHREKALPLFSLVDFGDKELSVIQEIRRLDTKKNFNYSLINKFLSNTLDCLIKENEQIKKDSNKQINELFQQISDLKNSIDTHFEMLSIVQENIIRNNKNNFNEDNSSSNSNDDNTKKRYYQEIVDYIILNESDIMDLHPNLKKRVILEMARLALNDQLDDDKIDFLFEICKNKSLKKIKDELIFLLSLQNKLDKKYDELKEEVEYVRVPANITSVEPSIFEGFPNIKKVSLHEKVQDIKNIETSIKELKEIVIPFSNESNIFRMLSFVDGMKNESSKNSVKASIRFSNGITKVHNLFGRNIQFKKIVSGFILPPSVENIESGAFVECELLKYIELPPKITKIPDRCFSKCLKLEKVKISGPLETIEENAFFRCESLKQIILPNSVKIIKNNAFEYSGLESIKLPSSLEKIEQYTFSGCKSLKSVDFNAKLKSIDKDAFFDCENLLSVDLSKCEYLQQNQKDLKNIFPSECDIIFLNEE